MGYQVITSFEQLIIGGSYHFESANVPFPISNVGSLTWLLVDDVSSFFCPGFNTNVDTHLINRIKIEQNRFVCYHDETYYDYFNSSSYPASFDFTFVSFHNPNNLAFNDVFGSSISYQYEEAGLIGNYSKLLTDYTGLSLGVLTGIISLVCLFCLVFKRG